MQKKRFRCLVRKRTDFFVNPTSLGSNKKAFKDFGWTAEIPKHLPFPLQMIAPGYYSQECNVHKPCPDATKYCHMFLCVDCLKENVACTQNGQCCPGTECTYGRCKKGSAKGMAGNIFV